MFDNFLQFPLELLEDTNVKSILNSTAPFPNEYKKKNELIPFLK